MRRLKSYILTGKRVFQEIPTNYGIMNKKTLILIWKLNNLYDTVWKMWVSTEVDSFEYNECVSKMKLIRTVSKNIEEQSRGFLKSKIDYPKWWDFIIQNIQKDYSEVHSGVTNILLGM